MEMKFHKSECVLANKSFDYFVKSCFLTFILWLISIYSTHSTGQYNTLVGLPYPSI